MSIPTYGPATPQMEPSTTVWLVCKGTDPGAPLCDSESTGRAYAETRYREDEDPDEPAALRWDEYGELLDDTDEEFPETGWRVELSPDFDVSHETRGPTRAVAASDLHCSAARRERAVGQT
ncbi:hypothetical protein [Streptomyces sp. NPDC056061]|uniref:hypothetical protein n=1 Tax=Streptomyces sp. NPDC056061 TaxID=3345700 RepID=UPI0035DE3FC6